MGQVASLREISATLRGDGLRPLQHRAMPGIGNLMENGAVHMLRQHMSRAWRCRLVERSTHDQRRIAYHSERFGQV
jgi:hypothetical protein